jgi:hypothetical protein
LDEVASSDDRHRLEEVLSSVHFAMVVEKARADHEELASLELP